MTRYFLELSYKGTNYAGFQIQKNANSIQAEVEKALAIYFRQIINLTGSSRTDAGVHAYQNYFHFDVEFEIQNNDLYHINSILPSDIALREIFSVDREAHCRFDALARTYQYYIYRRKDPFLQDRAFYYPYNIDLDLMQEAAGKLFDYKDFTSFSKRRTQVKTFECRVTHSKWIKQGPCMIFHIKANRFLRGMVRGLVGTILQIGRKKISLAEFDMIVQERNSAKVDFSVPPHGLCLMEVEFKK